MPTGSTNFPGALDGFPTTRADADLIGPDAVDHAAALNALETELGITPSGTVATVGARFSRLEAVLFPLDPGSLGTANDSTYIQAQIDAVSAAGGGYLLVPPGAYRIRNIDIKDDVVVWAPGVTFKFPASGLSNFDRLFLIGGAVGRRENIGLLGPVTLLRVSGDVGATTNLTGMSVESAKNFVFDGIIGQDWYDGNLINLMATDPGLGGLHCEDGRVTRIIDLARTHAGYGPIQIQGARRVFLQDLYTAGGNCVNLESDRRNTGTDFVEDITVDNCWVTQNAGSANTVIKFIPHTNTVRRIRATRLYADQPTGTGGGIYFATSNETQGGSISDVTIEDAHIVTPTAAGVQRQTGSTERDDMPGVHLRRIKVTNGAADGFLIGGSMTLEDCVSDSNVGAGFNAASAALDSTAWLPHITRFRRCRAYNNGGVGFIPFSGGNIWELDECDASQNGTRAFTTNGTRTKMRIRNSTYQHGAAGSFVSGTHCYFDKDSAKKPIQLGPWSQVNVAASQTNVALSQVRTATVKMDRAGSICGVMVKGRTAADARTAGTLTVEALKNGLALTTPLTAVLDGTNARAKSTDQATAVVGATFVATDTVGVRITTDGAWTPTTSDIDVYVCIVED